MAAVLGVLSLLIFLVYNLIPVDKAADMAMQEIAANKNLIYAERYLYWQRRFGLDGNLFTRYLRWVGLASFYSLGHLHPTVTIGLHQRLRSKGNLYNISN